MEASNDTLYLHTDNLGSVEAISDKLGAFVSRMSFSDWGKRQQSDWKTGSPTGSFPTANGYTGHHQLDQHKLVHMGGRVYDPGLGRFLSADLFVQSPYSSQSFNRYSYVFNNPLSNVDPSGYCTATTNTPIQRTLGSDWYQSGPSTTTMSGDCGGHDSGADAFNDSQNIAKNIAPHKVDLTQREIAKQYAEGCSNGTFSCHDAYNYIVDNGLSPYLDIGTVLKDFYKKAVEIALFGPSRAGASFVAPKVAGKTSVYQAVDANGKVIYIGITDNILRRAAEHLRNKGISIDEIPGLVNMARADARAVEQVLIEKFGLSKDGGSLLNRIHSIAESNPIYQTAIGRGTELLNKIGYPGF